MLTKFIFGVSIVGVMVGGCIVNSSGGDNTGGVGGAAVSAPSSVSAGGMATTSTSTSTTATTAAVGGNSAGGMGAGGTPPCASVEWCNGLDDNCMGGIDEECPTGVGATDLLEEVARGAAPPEDSNVVDEVLCSDGHAIVKIAAEIAGNFVVGAKVWCSPLGFIASTDGPHSEWELAASPPQATEDFDFGNNGTTVVSECANGTFAYGFEAHWTENQNTDNGLRAIGLLCARLRLVGDTNSLSWQRVAPQTPVIAGDQAFANDSFIDAFTADRALVMLRFRQSEVDGGIDRLSFYRVGSDRLTFKF